MQTTEYDYTKQRQQQTATATDTRTATEMATMATSVIRNSESWRRRTGPAQGDPASRGACEDKNLGDGSVRFFFAGSGHGAQSELLSPWAKGPGADRPDAARDIVGLQ